MANEADGRVRASGDPLPQKRVKIVTDGTSRGTEVSVDGVVIPVRSIEWRVGVGEPGIWMIAIAEQWVELGA